MPIMTMSIDISTLEGSGRQKEKGNGVEGEVSRGKKRGGEENVEREIIKDNNYHTIFLKHKYMYMYMYMYMYVTKGCNILRPCVTKGCMFWN